MPIASNHLREQLTSPSDERLALRIFIRTRRFTDEHKSRIVVSVRVHNLRTTRTQTATSTVADVTPDFSPMFR
jgi:hypothetical protein